MAERHARSQASWSRSMGWPQWSQVRSSVVACPQARGKVYELGGDTSWSLPELAAEISRAAGRDYDTIRSQHIAAATITMRPIPMPITVGW